MSSFLLSAWQELEWNSKQPKIPGDPNVGWDLSHIYCQQQEIDRDFGVEAYPNACFPGRVLRRPVLSGAAE